MRKLLLVALVAAIVGGASMFVLHQLWLPCGSW